VGREYPTEARDDKRFRETVSEIGEISDGNLKETEFSGVPFFYTLYCTVYHRMFGLPGERLSSPHKRLTSSERRDLWGAITKLSDIISDAREDPASVPKALTKFAVASTGQTTNIEPRRMRFETLYKEAF